MKKLFLTLPAGPGEEYPNGGGEGYWMGKIAEGMKALLNAWGVETAEDSPEGCGLWVALRSRRAPAGLAGQRKGLDVYYEENSAAGKRAAELFSARLKEVYPEPGLAGARPLPEAEKSGREGVPFLLVKLAYHDNPQDEAWLVNSTGEIAEALARAAAEALEVPCARA